MDSWQAGRRPTPAGLWSASIQDVVSLDGRDIPDSWIDQWIDYQVNPEGHRRLFEIMERCDGEHSVADIAAELKIPFASVWEVVALLKEKELVWLSREPHPTRSRV